MSGWYAVVRILANLSVSPVLFLERFYGNNLAKKWGRLEESISRYKR